MYFIINLLKSKDLIAKTIYDLIIIIINKLIIYIHFIQFKKNFDAEQLRYFFID